MPYDGPDDPKLPANVRKLPEKRRRQWIHVYDSARARGEDEGTSIRLANGVAKKEDAMEEKETAWAPFVDYEAKSESDDIGVVEGYASVFNARDHGKDRVLSGAFQKTLIERKNQIVYLPSHDYRIHVKDIPAVPIDIREDEKGLYTKTKFFLDTQAGKDSFTVIKEYQKAGRPLGLSYTFKPRPGGFSTSAEGRDLKEVDLFEYGHTALPMLDLARTVSAKSSAGNFMVHTTEVDHMHSHGDMIHSHTHAHSMYEGNHMYHDHTEDQMKSLGIEMEGESKRKYTEDQRAEMAKQGHAMEDGSFPIEDETDLKNAIQSVGMAKDIYAARRHIRRRAKELGKEDLLPDDWSNSKSVVISADIKPEDLLADFEDKIGKRLSEESTQKIRAALATLTELLGSESEESNKGDDFRKKTLREQQELEELLAAIKL